MVSAPCVYWMFSIFVTVDFFSGPWMVRREIDLELREWNLLKSTDRLGALLTDWARKNRFHLFGCLVFVFSIAARERNFQIRKKAICKQTFEASFFVIWFTVELIETALWDHIKSASPRPKAIIFSSKRERDSLCFMFLSLSSGHISWSLIIFAASACSFHWLNDHDKAKTLFKLCKHSWMVITFRILITSRRALDIPAMSMLDLASASLSREWTFGKFIKQQNY